MWESLGSGKGKGPVGEGVAEEVGGEEEEEIRVREVQGAEEGKAQCGKGLRGEVGPHGAGVPEGEKAERRKEDEAGRTAAGQPLREANTLAAERDLAPVRWGGFASVGEKPPR